MPTSVISLLHNKQYYSSEESYYPECENKRSNMQMFFDQLFCVLQHGEINDFYFLYGLDHKNRKEQSEYIQHCDFRLLRNNNNNKVYAELCVLRDKELFSIVGHGYGFPVLRNIGIMKAGIIQNGNNEFNIFDCPEIHGAGLFFKPLYEECGNGIFTLCKNDDKFYLNDKEIGKTALENFLKEQDATEFLVQMRLVQHDVMNRIYPHSVNTLRIVTVRDKTGKPIYFTGLLRIGANGNVVDNWAKGGIVVGIDSEGKLSKYGYFKPSYGKVAVVHPDTDVCFEGYVIPYFKEAVELCLKFHSKLKKVHSIGWDVAITPDGPCLVEGNDNFEISLHQVCDKPLKRELYKLYK